MRARDYGARPITLCLGLELDAITVVALGGTQLTGGVGGVVGTLIGVLFVGSLFNIFNLDATLNTFLRRSCAARFSSSSSLFKAAFRCDAGDMPHVTGRDALDPGDFLCQGDAQN